MFRGKEWLRRREAPAPPGPVRTLFSEAAPEASAPAPSGWPREANDAAPPFEAHLPAPTPPAACGRCGAADPLFHLGEGPLCYACLTERFRTDPTRDERWLVGEQLRGIEQAARAGDPLPPETALALIGDVRRLRRCIFQIQERIFALDASPHDWSRVRELGGLIATILALTEEVDPLQ